MGMVIYSDGTSEASHEDQSEYTQIEGLVGINHEGDDVFDRCQSGSGERSVKYSLNELWVGSWTHAVSERVYRGE